MAELSISFRNRLKTTNFNGQIASWLAPSASFAQIPESTLKAEQGQIMSVNTSTFGGYAGANIACWWSDPVTKARFGVQIIAAPQPFDLGNRPYWQIMFDHNDPSVAPTWINSGDSPASKYIWDNSIGFSIIAEPISGDYTLSIGVDITIL